MSRHLEPQSFTKFGWIVCAWVLVVSFQYGYHISTLNQIQAVLTCRGREASIPFYYGLPTCIPMSDSTFSVVTSVFTVGGLMGSLVANLILDRYGRKGAVQASGALFALGAGLMAISASIGLLMFGRALAGAGAGIGLCVGPIYLSELAPPRIKGSVGVLTQLAIVIGIMVTQAMGLQMATPTQWRFVLMFSSGLSVAQLIISPLIVETPVWLKRRGELADLKAVERRLWKYDVSDADNSAADVEDPLLEEGGEEEEDLPSLATERTHSVSVFQLLTARQLRRPFFVASFGMLAQQLSGINAVLYYSNDILSKSLPDMGPYISLGITIVNVLMTAPPIFLIERWGRRTLLLLSSVGAVLSLILVGYGLDSSAVMLASVAIMTFVTSFATGLGPVPFVIIPEVSPSNAVAALSSVALSLNWIANFFVGLVFLPLRNILSGGDAEREGRVFYVFAAALSLSTMGLLRSYRG